MSIHRSLSLQIATVIQSSVFLLGSELEELLQEVLEAKDLGISVLDKHHEDNNWSYGQSILFTVTVVTTIGTMIYRNKKCKAGC